MYKLSSSKESVEFSEKTRVDKVEVSVVLSKLALEHSMLIVSTVYYIYCTNTQRLSPWNS